MVILNMLSKALCFLGIASTVSAGDAFIKAEPEKQFLEATIEIGFMGDQTYANMYVGADH